VALRSILHPSGSETWKELSDAATHASSESEQKDLRARANALYLEEYEHSPPERKSVELARMMLQVTTKLDELSERFDGLEKRIPRAEVAAADASDDGKQGTDADKGSSPKSLSKLTKPTSIAPYAAPNLGPMEA